MQRPTGLVRLAVATVGIVLAVHGVMGFVHHWGAGGVGPKRGAFLVAQCGIGAGLLVWLFGPQKKA